MKRGRPVGWRKDGARPHLVSVRLSEDERGWLLSRIPAGGSDGDVIRQLIEEARTMETTAKSITIEIGAKQYEDHDDCLTAAADDLAAQRGLSGWDLSPRWADDQRDAILLDIPSWAARGSDSRRD